MKVINHLVPKIFEILEGPHTSIWKRWKGLKLILLWARGNKTCLCFANSQTSIWRFYKFKSLNREGNKNFTTWNEELLLID